MRMQHSPGKIPDLPPPSTQNSRAFLSTSALRVLVGQEQNTAFSTLDTRISLTSHWLWYDNVCGPEYCRESYIRAIVIELKGLRREKNATLKQIKDTVSFAHKATSGCGRMTYLLSGSLRKK